MGTATTSRWRALAALLRPDAIRWAGLGILLAAGSAFTLGGPLVVRRIVDRAQAQAPSATITRLAVLFLVIAVAGIVRFQANF